MSKYVLALDQSTQITGWALYKDYKELVHYGKIEPKGELINRVISLRDWVKKLVIGLKDNNQDIEIVIEEIQLQNIPGTNREGNVATFKKLAYVQAILLELAEDLKISYKIMASSSWKSSCGVRGSKRAEQKQNAQKFVTEKFNIKATQDESDAICIGYAYCMEERNKQLESDEGINWKD